MRIQGITVEVSNLAVSKGSTRTLSGSRRASTTRRHSGSPTTSATSYFAIREVDEKKAHDDFDITNFELDDVGGVWRG